ncbi:MAG: cysteine desulfurase [Clostridiales bacterium]|nr:cysteine desulfurase [Clostridiales bacterium]
MEIYLDNSATTRVFPEVQEQMRQAMDAQYGNPSSLHHKGVEAETYIKTAKTQIAKCLKVQEKEIIFTSGGTESNNMAIIGTAMANRRAGMHIITSSIEHPSVIQPMKYLEELGFRVTYLPVGRDGTISMQALEEALDDETILVSLMYVNNEIGTIEPIEQVAERIKKKNPSIVFHVDAIQAFGKLTIHPKRQGIDLLSVSGHKIHGPKGIGFLYINEKVKIRPIILGGGQQKGMRSGTENVPGIAGIGLAAQMAYQNLSEAQNRMYELRQMFMDGVSAMDGVTINGCLGKKGAPHIVSVSFEGVRSEVLLHALEDQGIYVSAGSACSSNKPAISATLKSIGVKKELLDSTIRFSFGAYTTEQHIETALQALNTLLPMLRRYRRKK